MAAGVSMKMLFYSLNKREWDTLALGFMTDQSSSGMNQRSFSGDRGLFIHIGLRLSIEPYRYR